MPQVDREGHLTRIDVGRRIRQPVAPLTDAVRDGIAAVVDTDQSRPALASDLIVPARVTELLRKVIPAVDKLVRTERAHRVDRHAARIHEASAVADVGHCNGAVVQQDLLQVPRSADDLDGRFRVEVIMPVIFREQAKVLGGIDLPVHLYRAVREALHGVLRILSDRSVNVELGFLIGRVEYTAFDQQRRLAPHIVCPS